jgi:electron transfer flavoprotein alpha subunit
MNKILIYLQAAAKRGSEKFELHPIGRELIGEGLRLAGETGAELYGIIILGTAENIAKITKKNTENAENTTKNAENIIENTEKNDEKNIFGEDFLSDIRGLKELRVYRNEIFDGFDALIYAKTLKACADEIQPDAILVGGTPEGRAVAPAAAALLKTGATADCCELKWDGRELLQIRPAFGGSMLAEISTPFSRPSVATVGTGFLKKYRIEKGEERVIVGARNGEKNEILDIQDIEKATGIGNENDEKIANGEKTLIAGLRNGKKNEILDIQDIEKAAGIGNEKNEIASGEKTLIAGSRNDEKTYEPNKKIIFCKPSEEVLSTSPLRKRSVAALEEFGEKETVVAVGGGVKNQGDLKIFYELCEKIGASLMCSRVVSEHGFLTRTRQIGLSGKTVRPKLLLTFGISGSAEFLAGIGADHIIAVNLDENAPIMKIADEAIVGDMYEIAREIIGRNFSRE